jgi:hypothetical protein
VFCPNVLVIEAMGFINGQLDNFFGTWGQADLAENGVITTTNNEFYGVTNFVQVDAELGEYFGGKALLITCKTKEEMFRADIVMLEAQGFVLREAQNHSGSLCELLKPTSIVHLLTPC